MKKLIICFTLSLCTMFAWAQEGNPYKGSRKVFEKSFDVVQKHGKNVLKLKTRTTGTYDSEGNIVHKHVLKGNLTYMGKVFKNYNDKEEEIITLNYMNLLSQRSVKIKGERDGELTEIVYDSKGKIADKISYRIYDQSQEVWQQHYSQLGYIMNHIQTASQNGKISTKFRYDYFDDIIERQYFIYDDNERLIEMYALSATDSLISKTQYLYDDKGNLTDENFYDKEERLVQSIRYFYDDKGRIIQMSDFTWDPRFGEIPRLRQQSDYEYI